MDALLESGCQKFFLTSSRGGRTVAGVTTPADPRDTISLRFKNPRNREALRKMAELTGLPQTDIAERAIEHEVVLLAADLERRLEDALPVVRGYLPEGNLDTYLDAIEQGEGLDDARGPRPAGRSGARTRGSATGRG